MIDPEEYVSVWGVDNLIRYGPDAVHPLSIPDESKRFLIETGLPRWNHNLLTFDVPPYNLPPITVASSRDDFEPSSCLPYDFPAHYSRYRILGVSGLDVLKTHARSFGIIVAFICIDLRWKGRIVSIFRYRGDEWKLSLMNSSLATMVEILTLDQKYRTILRSFEDCRQDEMVEIGRPFASAMRAADPAACKWPKPWAHTLIAIEGGFSP